MVNTQNTITNDEDAPQASPVSLHAIHPVNLLSFGPDTPEIPLGPLNLLIGPNGSGKSNLIEAICLLRASPYSLSDFVQRNGGVREWIWKGRPSATASIESIIHNPDDNQFLRHHIAFKAESSRFSLANEEIHDAYPEQDQEQPVSYYAYMDGHPRIRVGTGYPRVKLESFEEDDSILSQRRDPERYPQITYLNGQYKNIYAYREWAFGRNTIFRVPQPADMRSSPLEENFSNLGLFLNKLRREPKTKKAIVDYLHDIYEGVDDFDVSIEGGTVQVFFTEGDFIIPATRLSDGTLRYLCLLAILCDHTPPSLICIEEPELGLHPDILPKIADLLIEASSRTQLIVTTHSDILVDAMTDHPEAVLVCEKHQGQTQITRLSKEDLSTWLGKYRLGELWTRGELGGTRW